MRSVIKGVRADRAALRAGVARLGWLLATAAAGSLIAASAAAQDRDDENTVEEVLVTGTSIRGEQPVGSDLVSVQRDEIVAIGATSTSDLLAKVPQLNSFNNMPRPALGGAAGGNTTPGMRNLPDGATLFLLNGQRMVGDTPLDGVPDPSSIPPAAIERVEIVPDGASAVYGSEAVAGVINIITRRNLNGAETTLRVGEAQHGYRSVDVSQALGRTWSGGSALLVVAYTESDALQSRQLPYYQNDLRAFGGVDMRASNCAPPNIVVGGVTYAPPTYAPGVAARCDLGLSDVIPHVRRTSVIGNINHNVTENLNLFADLKHTATFFSNRGGPPSANVTITPANPFFQLPPGVSGTSATVFYQMPEEHILKTQTFAKAWNVVTGLNYRLPYEWQVTGTINNGWSDSRANQETFNSAALAAAAAGTTTLTALDPFGSRTSPGVIAAILNQDSLFTSHQTIQDYQVKADGPVFSLPGGDVKLAVGANYRKIGYEATNAVGVRGSTQGQAVVDAERTLKAAFAELFVPLVGEANGVPFIRSLSFSAAGRYDEYSDFGSTFNPKYGFTWEVVNGLLFRGSYGESFHAPDMGDSYAVDTRAIFGANSVLVPPGSPPSDLIVLAGGNPGLLPETAKTRSFGVEFTPEWFPGFRLSMTYYKIEYRDQVRSPPISLDVYTNPAFANVVTYAPTRAQLDEVAATFRLIGMTAPIPPVGYIVDLRRRNMAGTNTDGIDFEITYNWETSFGSWAAGVSGNEMLSFDIQSAAGAPFVPQTNVITTRLRSSLAWVNGPMSANAALNYSGDFTNTFVRAAGGTRVQKVKPFITLDLRAAYDIERDGLLGGTTLSLQVDNALDKQPPYVIAGGGYAGNANPLGRMVWLGLTKKW